MIKDELLAFAQAHDDVQSETCNVLERLKENVEDITDAQVIQSLREREFYVKHDLGTVRNLCEKYSVDCSALQALCEKYNELEQQVSALKNEFKKIGLDATIGPKCISGTINKVQVSIDTKTLEVNVFDPLERGEEEVKKNVEAVLERAGNDGM